MRAARGPSRKGVQNSTPLSPGGRRPEVYNGRVPASRGSMRMSPSHRRSRRRAVLPACLVLAAIAATGPVWAVRRQKSVFLSQPADWAPLMDEDHKAPTLLFKTAWSWSGFKAPLAGDPVLCAGSIVAASRDGEVAALDPIKGEV